MRALRLRESLTAAALGAALAAAPTANADEPGLFGRLFRMGGSNSSKPNNGKPASPFGEKPGTAPGRNHDHNHDHDRDPGGDAFIPPAAPRGGAPRTAAAPPAAAIPPGGGPSTPGVADAGPAPAITPRSRVSSAATEADPLLTRMALGRSNDGNKFGMFMQVYADGTVIDSEGVHRVSPADIKPLADLVASGELGRNRGHCGSPSGDYIEEVHVVVFERRLGRLTAQPFSYSGNPQGCDASVSKLHAVIDNLQLRLSGQPAAIADTGPVQTPSTVAALSAPAPAPEAAPTLGLADPGAAIAPLPAVGAGRVLPPLSGVPTPTGPVIPLSPADPR